MGSSQNLEPILVRLRNIVYNQKGPICLRITHVFQGLRGWRFDNPTCPGFGRVSWFCHRSLMKFDQNPKPSNPKPSQLRAIDTEQLARKRRKQDNSRFEEKISLKFQSHSTTPKVSGLGFRATG